jgi:hypothetical protein
VGAAIILGEAVALRLAGVEGGRGGEVGCYARPYRGGSNMGVKKGRRSAAEAFIVARRDGGRVTSIATRRRWAGEGCGASAAVRGMGVAGSGSTVVHA